LNAIDRYWDAVAREAEAQFARIRNAHRDSSVKGHGNESIVEEFLQQNTGSRRVATNSTISDHYGRASDEVDVAVINGAQPFWTSDSAQTLIAEGVDTAYQVKAILTKAELKRAIKNTLSVKQLLRVMPAGSFAKAVSNEDGTRFIDHIPFFIFAFTARISAKTAMEVLVEETPPDVSMQPDGVFVLDGWSLINVGSNRGALRIGPPEATGFQQVTTPRSSLAEMLWCHHLFLHRRVDFVSPIVQYAPHARLRDGEPTR
jgi:hypothetical protein